MTFYSNTVTDEENPPLVPKVSTIEVHELVPSAPDHVKVLEVGRIVYHTDENLDPYKARTIFARELATALTAAAKDWSELADRYEEETNG